MKRRFNTMGLCTPDRHYMVSIDERVRQIKEQYVDEGLYFIINRGRQYGKTTTLAALAEYLRAEYIVWDMDFQMISSHSFENEEKFVCAFIDYLETIFDDEKDQMQNVDEKAVQNLIAVKNGEVINLDKMFWGISRLCASSKLPIILLIDEVDSASNNQVFVDFLAQLRGYYLKRSKRPTFHSVILAGVYDIKNLKRKIRSEKEHLYNSPWNIAADFNIDMSLSAKQIAGMLQEYENDNHTGMDVDGIAGYIYEFTSGYPYLVSAICKILDENLTTMENLNDIKSVWTKTGVDMAVKILLGKKTTLFDSMIRQMSEYPEIKKMIQAVLFQGKKISYNEDTHEINLAAMFGYIKQNKGNVQVANRIFEMRLCNLFLSEEELTDVIYGKAQGNVSQFINLQNGS